jgi:peptide/nickel transport system permease protein
MVSRFHSPGGLPMTSTPTGRPPLTNSTVTHPKAAPAKPKSRIARVLDSDVFYAFRRSPLVMLAALLTVLLVGAAFLAPLIAPYNPYDLKTIDLLDGNTPPRWYKDGDAKFLLGTDNQGRDILSTILYGTRSSILVSLTAVGFALALGVSLGLIAGIADVQLTFPAILTALLVDGIAKATFKGTAIGDNHFWILVISIGLSFWVQYARTVRGVTLVEKNKDYVQAARLIGLSNVAIMFKHVLPNVLSPVLVIATINLALAIITEATLSFLGVGLPPTEPSLGTMIQVGNTFLLSGSSWMVLYPGLTLAVLVLAVNLLGDWLRDALNPRLR